jgi:small subunit ribosomal protein S6
MALPAPTYDLVLMLDSEAQEPARARILGEAREAIGSGGELLRDDAWGDRVLTYPIAHKATARYHLLQFRAAAPELLERLDRSLRFADEVVRFRIVKLKPGTPEAPQAPVAAATAGGAVEQATPTPTEAPAAAAAEGSEAGEPIVDAPPAPAEAPAAAEATQPA